jgi:hypothetical protein
MSSTNYLDFISNPIEKLTISIQDEQLIHLALLAIKIFHDLLISPSQNSFKILGLQTHSIIPLPDLVKIAKILGDEIEYKFSMNINLFESYKEQFGSTSSHVILEKLLRAIHYNSHTLPIPKLSDTYMLCITPNLAYLNHSCIPNCVLILEFPKSIRQDCNQDEKLIPFSINLQTISEVSQGEQLTISYLRQPCIPLLNRQEVLSASFHFTCNCNRCINERSCVHAELSMSEQFIMTKYHEILSIAAQSDDSNLKGNKSNSILRRNLDKQGFQIEAVVEWLQDYNQWLTSKNCQMIYACHDISMCLLVALNTAPESSDGNYDHAANTKTHIDRLKCLYCIGICWELLGNPYHHIRLQYLLIGISEANYLLTSSSDETIKEYKDMILYLCDQALDLFETIYCYETSNDVNSSSISNEIKVKDIVLPQYQSVCRVKLRIISS